MVFKSRKIVALVVVLLIAGVLIWRAVAKKEAKPQLQTAAVERGMIVESVSASGQVLSVNVMSANTKASGIVKKVYVKDGDEVRKGDKILEIDLDFQGKQKNAQALASYLSAKNSLESAKYTQYSLESTMWASHESFESRALDTGLSVEDPVYIQTNRDWLAAEAKYKNQPAVIAQAQTALNSSWLSYQLTSPVITAPTDGMITSLMYTEGMSIGSLDTGSSESNQKVATIKTAGTPIVSVNLSEIDVSRVELGQKVTVTLDSITDKTFTGVVVGVDRIGQTTSGVTQYPAIIRLDAASEQILPNMTVTTNIVIARKDNVLLVPSSAVSVQAGQSYVSILKNGQSQSVPVETGLTSDTQTEIVSGVEERDLVVVATTVLPTSQQTGTSPFGTSRGINQIMRIPR